MNVVFRSKSASQNRFTITDSKFGKLFFDKGVYTTTDKERIRALLNHTLKKRGDILLESNAEMVAKYLDGEEADMLTREILDGITRQGIIELGKVLGAPETQPTLIKEEIIAEPITDAVQEVLDFYTVQKEPEPVRKEEVKKAETFESEEVEVKEKPAPKNKGGRPKKKK